jgi:hypothetical protein
MLKTLLVCLGSLLLQERYSFVQSHASQTQLATKTFHDVSFGQDAGTPHGRESVLAFRDVGSASHEDTPSSFAV